MYEEKIARSGSGYCFEKVGSLKEVSVGLVFLISLCLLNIQCSKNDTYKKPAQVESTAATDKSTLIDGEKQSKTTEVGVEPRSVEEDIDELLSSKHPVSLSSIQLGTIARNYGILSDAEVREVIDYIYGVYELPKSEKIPIRGVLLYRMAGNIGTLFDDDQWLVDAAILSHRTGNMVYLRNLFRVNYSNSGLKVEVSYKTMITFIPSDLSIGELNNAVFGRGIGLNASSWSFPPIHIEGAWMPGKNRTDSIYHLGIGIGIGVGISFPKMEFFLRDTRPSYYLLPAKDEQAK